MKYVTDRPYADPEKAARKILEIANGVEVVQDGRIYIDLIKGPFRFREKGTPEEYKAGLDLAIERSWLTLHESGHLRQVHASGVDQVVALVMPGLRTSDRSMKRSIDAHPTALIGLDRGGAGNAAKHCRKSGDGECAVFFSVFEKARRYGCATFDPIATYSPDQA